MTNTSNTTGPWQEPCSCGSGLPATLPPSFGQENDCPACAPDEAAMARDPEGLAKLNSPEGL